MHDAPVAIGSGAILGVDAVPVLIEATLRGAGSPRILGQVDSVVREAYHRILTAFAAQGVDPPRGAPTINFAPAHIRKTGSGFDLPMALAIAGAAGLYPTRRTTSLGALGEVSLQGAILPVRGAVAVAMAVASTGRTTLLMSPVDAAIAALVPGVSVHAASCLREAMLWLRGEVELPPVPPLASRGDCIDADLADIRGHETAKWALAVAAAGRHNLLLVGPPGTGKSALLRRLAGLLPPPSAAESLDILKVHTASGTMTTSTPRRPIRAPHHSSSHVSLLGGGPDLRPGEVSLAHHGVLLLDEFAEFRREALEGLRQPLEDGVVVVGRARGTVRLPADFLLAAAMNPCPCGFLGHPARPCTCGPAMHRRYRARISGPLLDRIDLQVEVPALPASELRRPTPPDWATPALRRRVAVAIERQRERNARLGCPAPNGRLSDAVLERAAATDDAVNNALDHVLTAYRLSGRSRVRLLRLARTIADLADREHVGPEDIVAASRLRGVERVWNPLTVA